MALKTKSTIFRGKTEKVRALVSRLALMICAKENASLYDRFAQQRKKYLTLKMMIIKKYTPKALVAARKLLQGQGSK